MHTICKMISLKYGFENASDNVGHFAQCQYAKTQELDVEAVFTTLLLYMCSADFRFLSRKHNFTH